MLEDPQPPLADSVSERGTPEWKAACAAHEAWFKRNWDPKAISLKMFCDANDIPTFIMGVPWAKGAPWPEELRGEADEG